MLTANKKLEKMTPAQRKKALEEITNQGIGGKKPAKPATKRKTCKK